MNLVNQMDNLEITPVPEILADTTRVCEIRFDCMVSMHDVGYRRIKDVWGQEKQSKTPQWFRANHKLTLEGVKHADPYELGMRIKQMFYELEKTIERYEKS